MKEITDNEFNSYCAKVRGHAGRSRRLYYTPLTNANQLNEVFDKLWQEKNPTTDEELIFCGEVITQGIMQAQIKFIKSTMGES